MANVSLGMVVTNVPDRQVGVRTALHFLPPVSTLVDKVGNNRLWSREVLKLSRITKAAYSTSHCFNANDEWY